MVLLDLSTTGRLMLGQGLSRLLPGFCHRLSVLHNVLPQFISYPPLDKGVLALENNKKAPGPRTQGN